MEIKLSLFEFPISLQLYNSWYEEFKYKYSTKKYKEL